LRGKAASIGLRIALIAVAALVLRRELAGVVIGDLADSLRGYGLRHLALSLVFTALSFLILGALELLALRYVGKRAQRIVPRRSAIATAFVAHAYSQSVGLAILTGTAVRVRSYSRYGLDAVDVARLSAFVTVSAALGLLTTGAAAFLQMPGRMTLRGNTFSLAPIGLALLLLVLSYMAWAAFGRADFHGRGSWRVRRPSFPMASGQIVLSSLDWLAAGTVLFFLLPTQIHWSYSGVLGVYLVAQTVAVLSHVPGGVGIFEAIVLMLLTADASGKTPPGIMAALVASLLLYRIAYYLLPLCGAIALSLIAEMIWIRSPAASHDQPLTNVSPVPLSVDAV
jgi:phosphatidylglycerol lysyltransferase